MKVFSPSSAIVIGAAVAVSSFGHVDAAACTFANGATGTAVTVTKGTVAGEVTTPGESATAIARSGTACTAKQIPYLKSLVVIPAAAPSGGTATDITKVAVDFYMGTDTNALGGVTKAQDCDLKYTDVGKTKSNTGDIKFKFKCSDTATDCKVSYVAEWACYDALFAKSAVTTLKRKSDDGANCVDANDACVDRCFRSVTVTTVADGTTAKIKSAFTPTGCSCAELSVTTVTDLDTASGTDFTVKVKDGVTTLDRTGSGKVCAVQYEVGTYTNPIPVKTFTRGTVTPTSCVKETDCDYKCAAELAVTVSGDEVTGTPATVSGCTCKPLTAVVNKEQTKADGKSDTATYSWSVKDSALSIVTKISDAECTAPYSVKTGAATGSGSGSKSTPTSGVSVNTIWAVAATAVVAVAGAFVMV